MQRGKRLESQVDMCARGPHPLNLYKVKTPHKASVSSSKHGVVSFFPYEKSWVVATLIKQQRNPEWSGHTGQSRLETQIYIISLHNAT